MLTSRYRKILTGPLFIVFGLILYGCGSVLKPSTGVPTEPTKPAAATAVSSQPLPEKLETTSDIIPAESRLGQLFLNYPIALNPGASKVVNFNITIPAELAGTSAESYQRDVREANSPRPLGRFTEYTTLILVSQRMRVELVAPNFNKEDLYPSEQEIDLVTPNAQTKWGWTITAPGAPNEYVIVVKVSMVGNEIPVWVGSFDVVVESPTPIPQPTASPVPTQQPLSSRILQNIADNSVTLIAAILTTAVAIIGLYLQQQKNKSGRK